MAPAPSNRPVANASAADQLRALFGINRAIVARVRKEAEKKFVWGEGSDNVSMFEERSKEAEEEMLRRAKAWQALRFDNGFAWITGPTEYGGAGLTVAHERAYNQVEREYKTAPLGAFQIGLGMVAPTILAHASPKARDMYLRKMWRQLFYQRVVKWWLVMRTSRKMVIP